MKKRFLINLIMFALMVCPVTQSVKASGLRNIDLTKWSYSEVIDMSLMFNDIATYENLSEWDVSKVNDMSLMFRNITYDFEKLDLQEWSDSFKEQVGDISLY